MSKTEESIDGMEKFNEKIYEDGITWLFGHHCLECGHLTFAQHEVKELAKYFYELGYNQAERDLTDKAKTSSGWDGFFYGQGYMQAEKDNELTWEDLKLLQDISQEVFAEVANGSVDYYQIYPTQQLFLEEVLKRFKERKETKD